MKNIEELRCEIDRIDDSMASLFEERMNVCREIAEYKQAHALPICDPAREAAVTAAAARRVSDPILREYYTCFVGDVMKTSRAYQKRLAVGARVVYGGAEGAFAHIAALKLFPGSSPEPRPDFTAAYRAVESGEFDCAVLPIENSYAGDVGTVMDLIFSGLLYINKITELDVDHSLLGLPGADLDGIKTAVSHPQALEQCADFLREHGITPISFSNTALAAKHVLELGDSSVAAIASADAAAIYGLETLAERINAERANTTRFALLTRSLSMPDPAAKSGHEHFVLVFTTKNEAGALAGPLNIIGAHNFNMRGLRSRPLRGSAWSYYFLVEADGNIASYDGQNMLHELGAVCSELKLVGAYTD